MITYVLYALPKDEERAYMETIITETKDLEHLNKAKAWAISEGFKALRVYEHVEGSRPDFIKALNI